MSPRRGKGLSTTDEARRVRAWIAERTPERLQLPFALWTGRAVRELIEQRFAKRLGLSTVRLYLQRWGMMTPRRPLARAKGRRPAAIAAWSGATYPAIAKRARAAQAVIYWGDATGISNQDPAGRSYAPRGKTPVVARPAKRIPRGMISAVGNRGLLRFMLYDGALNAERFIDFLRRLIKDAGPKVALIVDDLTAHRAAKATARVASHAHEIELRYLPPYAPDHNPTAYLHNDLEQKLRQQPQPGSKDELVERPRSVLRAIQRSPERIQDYFKPEPVRYAA